MITITVDTQEEYDEMKESAMEYVCRHDIGIHCGKNYL